jgi:hypothetical protein
MKIAKSKLIEMAGNAVADRGLNYGKPEDNFNRIATRWRAHLKNRFGLDVPLDAVSVAMMCADLKLARLENTPHHLDSWVDLAGYSACGANIAAEDPAPVDTQQDMARRLHDTGILVKPFLRSERSYDADVAAKAREFEATHRGHPSAFDVVAGE